jgi:signal transduction histidine kinase
VDYYDESNLPEMTLDGMIASYSKPIYNHDGKLLGVISSDLSLERMSKLIASEKPYPNAYFMMLGEGGRYLLHPDATRLFKKTIFTGVSPRKHPDIIALGHDMMVDNSGRMEVVLDGVPCLVCYMALPGTPWSLALVCPNEDIMSSYHQFVKTVVVILCIGLLVILFLGSRAVSHAVRPLKQLLLKTQSIAEGNMEVYIPVSKREDAVGRLQNSFAKMLQSLNFHIGITRYITEQTQQRNEELAEATRLVAEADKRKTTFIQNVTHQIRTPLNIVIGFAQILRDAVAEKANNGDKYAGLSEEDVKRIGSTMTHNAVLIQRMVAMLFDSSDLGLSEELNSVPHDTVRCNDVVREAIEHVKYYYADINIGFETELDDDFSILTNHIYLKRSLSEILYNAAKYSDGQHVTARVSRIGNTVRFIIEDRGKGITEEECDSVFEPFMKVDTLSEGLGLGLPLSKRHILTLGGELTLDASYHDGCRIIITLPI